MAYNGYTLTFTPGQWAELLAGINAHAALAVIMPVPGFDADAQAVDALLRDAIKLVSEGQAAKDRAGKLEAAAVIRRVAPNLRLPTAVRATGVPPEHRQVADLPAAVPMAVAGLLNQVEGTVGVITPVGRRDEVTGWLAPNPRVQVFTSLEVKGVEYDAVVLVEPAEVEAQPAGTSTLYVALSRATQRLVTVTATR